MFCRKCGKEVKPGERFCKYCGNAITVSDEGKNGNSWFKKGDDLAEKPSLPQAPGKDLHTSSAMYTPKSYTLGGWDHKKTTPPKVITSKKPAKKKWLIFGGVACCVLVLITIFAILKLNIGLGKREAQEQLDAVLETIYEESSSDNFIMEALNGNVNVCMDRIYAKNDNYIAVCTVSAPDVATSISNYIDALSANKEVSYTDAVEALKNQIQTAPIITKSFDVRFVNSQGNWHPVVPEGMVVFCCGNIRELLPLIYSILEGSEK